MKTGMQRMPITSGAMTLAVVHCEETPPAMVKGFRLLERGGVVYSGGGRAYGENAAEDCDQEDDARHI
jgi:hypothetical protein